METKNPLQVTKNRIFSLRGIVGRGSDRSGGTQGDPGSPPDGAPEPGIPTPAESPEEVPIGEKNSVT